MKTTLTAIIAITTVLASMTATADPTRDGESIVEGTLDQGDCELVLGKNIERAGLTKDLKVDYVKRHSGFTLIRADVRYRLHGEQCVIDWFRTTHSSNVFSYLQSEFPDIRDWDDLPPIYKEEGLSILRDELARILEDDPQDIILEPVLEATDNVKVNMTTIFSAHEDREMVPYIVTDYHSEDF